MRPDEASTEDFLKSCDDLAFHAAGIGHNGVLGQIFPEFGTDRFDSMRR